MRNSWIRILTVLTLVMAATPLAEARGKGGRGDWMRDQKEMFEKLDLTAEQRDQLAAIRKEARKNMKPFRKERKDTWLKLQDSFKSDASEEDIRKNHKAFVELRTRVAEARLESILAIRKILTPEQRKKLSELKEEQRKKHGHGGAFGPGGEGNESDAD